jgi:hypothetical protein
MVAAMPYLPLRQEEFSGEKAPDNDAPLSNLRTFRRADKVTIYMCIMTTLLSCLLMTNLFVLRKEIRAMSEKPETWFETRLEADTNMMSLDHRFDNLWEDDLLSGETKIIDLAEEGSPEKLAASIGMYDTASSQPKKMTTEITPTNRVN